MVGIKILSYFFTSPCSLCQSVDSSSESLGVCSSCLRELTRSQNLWHRKHPHCEVCYKKLELVETDLSCKECQERYVFWDFFFPLRLRGRQEKELFQNCKFGNEKLLSRFFSLGLWRVFPYLHLDPPETIAIVPSEKKQGLNPFHPTCVLVQRLRRKWKDIKILTLEKRSKTKQSSVAYESRFFHAKSAFLLGKKDRMIAGRHILLIDDISTTGASLNELAKQLVKKGARRVSCIVLLLSEGYK